jgi:NADPH:quinone reductase-like Zn-dependent oxidoreductase
MKAVVVPDQAAGTAGMTLVERPEPSAAINDVIVRIHASGFVPTEMAWPSTWTDRRGRARTPSIPGHELAGVVTALGYGTTGLWWDSGFVHKVSGTSSCSVSTHSGRVACFRNPGLRQSRSWLLLVVRSRSQRHAGRSSCSPILDAEVLSPR